MPDRLLTELRDHKAGVGKRTKESGFLNKHRSGDRLTRKERRSAERLEKKQKTLQNRLNRLNYRMRQKRKHVAFKETLQAAKRKTVCSGLDEKKPSIPLHASSLPESEESPRPVLKTARTALKQNIVDKMPDNERISQNQKLAKAIEDEKRTIHSLSKRLGIAKQVTKTACTWLPPAYDVLGG